MSLIAFCVVDESLVVQFADHQIVPESTWQAGSAFHSEPLEWIGKSFFSYAGFRFKSIEKQSLGMLTRKLRMKRLGLRCGWGIHLSRNDGLRVLSSVH